MFWASLLARATLVAALAALMVDVMYVHPTWAWIAALSFLFGMNAIASLAILMMSREIGDATKPAFRNPLQFVGCLVFAFTPWNAVTYLTPGFLLSRLAAALLHVDHRRTDAFLVGDKEDLEWEFFGRAAALTDWKRRS